MSFRIYLYNELRKARKEEREAFKKEQKFRNKHRISADDETIYAVYETQAARIAIENIRSAYLKQLKAKGEK